ncbi:MAG: hypothetical protein U0520_01055 [Candidatus Saccharimonadales bacterium]
MRGVVYLHAETGTEGGDWAFQDEAHVTYRALRSNFYQETGGDVCLATSLQRMGEIIAINPDIDAEQDRFLEELRTDPDLTARDIFFDTDGTFKTHERKIARMYENGDKRVSVRWRDGEEGRYLPEDLREQQWSYSGMHYLHNGDSLTVYDRSSDGSVVWQGEVNLRFRHTRAMTEVATIAKSYQLREDFEFWQGLFVPESPATLVPRERS